MDSAFDLFFNAMMGVNQAMLLFGGGVMLLLGGALVAYPVYMALTGKKVRGKISGIRVSNRIDDHTKTSSPGSSGESVDRQGESGMVDGPDGPGHDDVKSWAAFGTQFKKSPGAGVAALLVALFVIGIPSLFIGVGGWFAYDYLSLSTSGVSMQAMVVDNEYEDDTDGGGTWHAVVEFRDESGREWRVRDHMGKSGNPSFSQGAHVPVRYERGDLEHMVIGGFWHNMTLPIGFAGLGGFALFFILVGGQKVFGKRKRKGAGCRKKVSYAGEMYAPIYEYRAKNGQRIEAEGGSRTNWILSMLPGKAVRLRLESSDPQKVERFGVLLMIFGLVFFVPGLLMTKAALSFETNGLGLLVFAGVMVFAGFKLYRKFRKIIKPRELWETRGQFKMRMKEKAEEKKALTHVLSRPEIRVRAQSQIGAGRGWAIFFALISLGLMAGGVYLSRDMTDFLAKGVSAPGKVVRVEGVSGTDSTTYYPVVRFAPESGKVAEFRDRVGSNPAIYQAGDTVRILYDPARPQKAMIDRGLWNWSASFGCLLGGVLLLLMAVQMMGALRRARAWR